MNNTIKNQAKTESIILVPIYNEQKHIFNVLREVRKYSPEDLLVVNDGSTDESREIVEEIASCAKLKGKLIIINHSENKGYGKSLIDGINFAQENNYRKFGLYLYRSCSPAALLQLNYFYKPESRVEEGGRILRFLSGL